METKSILSLPTELLAYITSLLPARDILSFALTCHAFENGASDGLRELQRIFLEYQTLNDNHPLGLLNKLRTILVDPFRAQCVRNLHFYDIRSSWVDWPPLSNIIDNERGEYVSIVDARHASENSNSNWEVPYSYEELEEYRRLLRAHISRSFTRNTLSNAHISMLRHGQDDSIKLLLIALCPKLKALNFYTFGPAKPNRPRLSPHPLFHSFLGHDQGVHQIFNYKTRVATTRPPLDSVWPPGFSSLRSVSICAPLPSSEGSEPFHTWPANVSGLFWLPNIRDLELRHLRHRRDGDEWIDVNVGCSNVENLTFESCQITLVTMLRFITAARSLRQLTIQRSGRNLGFMKEWVGYWYAESLGR